MTKQLKPQPDLRGKRGWRLSSIRLPWWLSGKQFVSQYMRHRRQQFNLWKLQRSTGSTGGGNGNPFQCSCLGNPRDRRVWRTIVLGVAKSQTWLSNWTLIPKGSNWVNYAYIMRPSWNPKRKEFGFWRTSEVVNQWGLGENGIPRKSRKLGSPFYTPCPRPLFHLAILELHRL